MDEMFDFAGRDFGGGVVVISVLPGGAPPKVRSHCSGYTQMGNNFVSALR